MIDSLDAPLREFHDELQRLKNLVDLIEKLRGMGSASFSDKRFPDDFEKIAIELSQQVHNLDADIPILSGTLILYLAGRFENFIRTSFEALCESYAEKCMKFEDLPSKMQNELISQTAKVIAQPKRYGFDGTHVHSFVANLSENMQAKNGLGQINSSCLSITEQNMRSDTLAELYRRVGISSLWTEISKQSKLKGYFKIAEDRPIEQKSKAYLNEIMDVRNTIAHPSTMPTFPDSQQIKGYIDFLNIFGEVLTEVCRVQIAIYKPGNGS